MSTLTSRSSKGSRMMGSSGTATLPPPKPVQPPQPEPEEVEDLAEDQGEPVAVERTAPKFELLRSETFQLSREEAMKAAHEHLSLPHSPTERLRDRRRVKELVDRIKGGTWLPCSWATVLYDGIKFRMNGQHSSEAIVEGAEYLPDLVGIHLDHYKANDRESMALLFRQFDARFSSRTKQDVAGAYQGLVRELEPLSRQKAKVAIEGIAWYQRQVLKEPTATGDAIYELFFFPLYYPFLRWFEKIITSKTRELLPMGVVGAMRATFIISESGSQEFWPHVAKQDMPDDKDPRTYLGQELQTVLESKKTDKPVHLTQSEYYCKCIKAWNAYRFGEKVTSLKVSPSKGWPEIAD